MLWEGDKTCCVPPKLILGTIALVPLALCIYGYCHFYLYRSHDPALYFHLRIKVSFNCRESAMKFTVLVYCTSLFSPSYLYILPFIFVSLILFRLTIYLLLLLSVVYHFYSVLNYRANVSNGLFGGKLCV